MLPTEVHAIDCLQIDIFLMVGFRQSSSPQSYYNFQFKIFLSPRKEYMIRSGTVFCPELDLKLGDELLGKPERKRPVRQNRGPGEFLNFLISCRG